jgi:hypothetical protein
VNDIWRVRALDRWESGACTIICNAKGISELLNFSSRSIHALFASVRFGPALIAFKIGAKISRRFQLHWPAIRQISRKLYPHLATDLASLLARVPGMADAEVSLEVMRLTAGARPALRRFLRVKWRFPLAEPETNQPPRAGMAERAPCGSAAESPVDFHAVAVHTAVPRLCCRSDLRSGILRVPRHCREKRLISISAWLSQLPWVGV